MISQLRTGATLTTLLFAVTGGACEGSSTATQTDTTAGSAAEVAFRDARPGCLAAGEGHARICGLVPPTGDSDQGTAYKLTTIAGDSFVLVVPPEFAPDSGLVAVPGAPVRLGEASKTPRPGLTTAPPRNAAASHCTEFPSCEVRATETQELGSGAIIALWEDRSRSVRLEVTTVKLGGWTLSLDGANAAAEKIARGLAWNIDDDGFIRLRTRSAEVVVSEDWADATVHLRSKARWSSHLVQIIPGCELSSKAPDLGGTDAESALVLHEDDEEGTVPGGRWCADGYWVDVSFIDRERLMVLYDELQIRSLGGAN